MAPKLLLSLFLVSAVHGFPLYLNRIPNGNKVKINGASWLPVGHLDKLKPRGNELNEFGKAFQAAGRQWTVALCEVDSDGDGWSNGEELGDPDCTWTPGSTPKRTSDITHPGDDSSKPTTATTLSTTALTTATTSSATTASTTATTSTATTASTTATTSTATTASTTATTESTTAATSTATTASTTAITSTESPTSRTTTIPPEGSDSDSESSESEER